jgi:hypothetical protein
MDHKVYNGRLNIFGEARLRIYPGRWYQDKCVNYCRINFYKATNILVDINYT